jgi:nicotinate-nucleotide adenylyltransferase
MERIGIYGGTFNPPHIGHMRAAAHGVEALKLDKLLLIPNGSAPHKIVTDGVSGAQRLKMLELSARGMKMAQVSDLELRREGMSYTADTIAELRRQYPGDELILMMGTDMFLSFLSWRRPEEILENASLAVFCRGEKNEQNAIAGQKEKLESMGAKIYLVANPVTAISSTDLRRMLVFRCADSFLCPGVGEYIRSEGLYGTGKNVKGRLGEPCPGEKACPGFPMRCR